MQLSLFGDIGPRTDLDPDGQTCVVCNETKGWDYFPKHKHYAGGKDKRCRTCVAYQASVRNTLRKVSPAMSDVCDCCGKSTYKTLVLDHCHDTDTFRGWLCEWCNVGIGKLGDNLDGVLNAVAYLEKFEESK